MLPPTLSTAGLPDRDGKVNLLGGGTAGGWALSAEAAKDPDKQAAFDAFCKYFFSSDVYGEYCEAMAAIPTTVETPKMNSSEQSVPNPPVIQSVVFHACHTRVFCPAA